MTFTKWQDNQIKECICKVKQCQKITGTTNIKKDEIGWDIGFPSPAIKEYIDQLNNKNISILLPGCGNAYEAEYLLAQGFKDITLIDIAPLLTAALKKKFKNSPGEQVKIITGDFFEHIGTYHLILELFFRPSILQLGKSMWIKCIHCWLKVVTLLEYCLVRYLKKRDRPLEVQYKNINRCFHQNL